MTLRAVRAFALTLLGGLLSACGASSAGGSPGSTALPEDFLWGVASSAFQSEGGDVDANWNRYNVRDADQDPYGTSVDFRHRYREDIALAGDLGVNVYRIGVDWARVEPRRGEFDAAELAYYDDVIAELKRRGITPLITLDHWAYPGWVLDQGGWDSAQTVDDFVEYARRIVTRYHGDTHLWLTFNEAAFYTIGEVKERQLAPISNLMLANLDPFVLLMAGHLVDAHRRVYTLIHALDAQAMVSSNIVWMGKGPAAATLQVVTDALFLDRVRDTLDYLAFDYYYGDAMAAILSGQTWAADPAPAGIYDALQKLATRFPTLPLLVAENGLSTENGQPRPDGLRREDVLRDTVWWMQQAHADGVNVIGYLYWSLTDNFEWGSYTPRFGLYTVNVLSDPALTRIPTAAVPAYGQIIRDRGLPADYRPLGS